MFCAGDYCCFGFSHHENSETTLMNFDDLCHNNGLGMVIGMTTNLQHYILTLQRVLNNARNNDQNVARNGIMIYNLRKNIKNAKQNTRLNFALVFWFSKPFYYEHDSSGKILKKDEMKFEGDISGSLSIVNVHKLCKIT